SLGGICLNWGCIPTKALIKSAEVFEYAKHAADYGIEINDPKHNFGNIIKRSRGVADKMNKGIQFLMKKNKIDVVMGNGKLIAANKLEVTANDGKKQVVEAKNIIIATGARARELPALKLDGKKVVGYRDAMNLPDQPKSMIIVGSGAIGTEFAYFYNSIGTKVTIVEFLPRIVPVEDEEISKELEKSFKKQGIAIMVNSEVTKVDTSGNGVKATIKTQSGEQVLEADILLSAVGIAANIENIGLEELGVKVDKGRVIVDQNQMTNVPGVYAIGDCTPHQALAHKASKEGINAAEHLCGKKVEPINYENVPGCTYCSPEIASVGYTEKAAKDAGYELKVGKFPFMASGKATAAGDTTGFVKIIYDAKYGELLGCHMIG
ncbi:MAG: dihydrolipoyl dehydrogenase, partial [Bacteroidia bacterium]|nr:dihydrolipoyl dehydrogenase [Bacteroidia bacterium]